MPVGNVRPETTVSAGPCDLTRTIAPVPGVGPPPERHAIPLAGSGGLLLASGQGPRSIQLIFCHGLSTHWALSHPAYRSVRKRVLPFSGQVSR